MRYVRLLLTLPVTLAAAPVLANEPASVPDRETAQRAYVAGDYVSARQLLEALLVANPDDPDLLRRLAAVEAALGDLAGARNSINRALSLAPDDGDIKLARANILLWSNELAEARREAEELSASRPDYPGLREFYASLQRAQDSQALRLRSLHIGTSVSDVEFATGRSQSWFTQRAAVAITWAGNSGATLGIEHEERQQSDTRIHGRVDLPISSDRIFITAGVTPNPDFRASWNIGAGSEIAIGSAGDFLIDASFAEYRSDDVVALGAGYRHRFMPELAVTARTINLFGGGADYRFGGALRVDYTPAHAPEFFAIIASYPDTEIDGTRQLRAVAAGTMMSLSDNLQLRFSGEYESRKSSYERASVSFDLSWLFGGQQ